MKNIFLKSPSSKQEFADYFQCRWQLLRKPFEYPPGSEQDDQESNSYHCNALNLQGCVIGVGRITPVSSYVMRIRYMGVEERYRHQGVGRMILNKLLEYAKQNNAQSCWLNARSDAVKFYQKNEFEIVCSIETDLPVPHYRMEIKLRV